MAKFGINDILNAKTKAAGQQAQTDGYKEIYLSPYEVKAAQENTHQKLENIEELADSFLHVGQEQPTVLARVNGEYRIIDGHRRNAANILNLERGHKEYEKVLYRFMDMSEAMYELRLLAGNGYTQELTAYFRRYERHLQHKQYGTARRHLRRAAYRGEGHRRSGTYQHTGQGAGIGTAPPYA